MQTIWTSQKLSIFEIEVDSILQTHGKILVEALFPGTGLLKEGFISNVFRNSKVVFQDVLGYDLVTTVERQAAATIAYQFISHAAEKLKKLSQSGRIPQEFLYFFENLKADTPSGISHMAEKDRISWWQVFFRYEYSLGDSFQQDAFLDGPRRSRFAGQVEGAWVRIDLGRNGKVIGMLLNPVQSPRPKPIDVAAMSHLVVGKPQVSMFASSDPTVLVPFLKNSARGVVPLVVSEEGKAVETNPYGIWKSLFTNDTRNFLPWSEFIFQGDGSDPEAVTLRVAYDDIGFHSYDPGIIPDGQRPPADSYDYPSLRIGEKLEFIEKTQNGWLKVRRVGDRTVGYVDWRYVEIDVTLPDVIIPSKTVLNEPAAIAIVDEVDKVVKGGASKTSFRERIEEILDPLKIRKRIPLLPDVPGVDVEPILIALEQVFQHVTLEGMALLFILMNERGLIHSVLSLVESRHFEKHWQIILLLLMMLPVDQLFGIVSEFFRTEALRKLVRERFIPVKIPWVDDPNPIDKKAIASELIQVLSKVVKGAAKDEMEFAKVVAVNVEYLFRMREYELEYVLSKGNHVQISEYLYSMDAFVNWGFELLLGKAKDVSLVELVTSPSLSNFWNYLKTERERPTIYLRKEGGRVYDAAKGESPELGRIFCFKTQQLLTDLPTPVASSLDSDDAYRLRYEACLGIQQQPQPTVAAPSPSTPSASPKDLAKKILRESLLESAARIKGFFGQVFQRFAAHPEYTAEINQVLRDGLREAGAKRLTLPEADQKRFIGKNAIEALDLNGVESRIRDSLQWIDIARIWYYELGSESRLGAEGKEIIFGKDALTTKDLRSHPSAAVVHEYITARARAGNFEEVELFEHFNFATLWKAGLANDVAFNLLGSVTVIVRPNQNSMRYSISILNNLGLESGTRFFKNEAEKRIEGLIPDHERDQTGTINLGGTLRCIWAWEEELQ